MGSKGSGRVKEYRRLLEELKESGEATKLVEALEMIPHVVEELVEKRIGEVKASLNQVSSELRDLRGLVEKLAGSVEDLERRYSELNRRLSGVEVMLGGFVEAMLSRVIVEELESLGYTVKISRRNHKVNDEDIDLLVVAERDGRKEHFIVEVKVKPSHTDIGTLLAKTDLYELRTGVRPKPILAGVWIGIEVEAYAKTKGVVAFKL
ncbi:MAG: hypothetical protein F7B17_06940 [Desulfurococcales archaeon]|nr:hypothetical protein [Desulfurococcales archaeon]